MRYSKVTVALLLATSGASASWFSSEQPAYASYDVDTARAWLKDHNIEAPKGYSQSQLQDLIKANWYSGKVWTEDQVQAAQAKFGDLKDKTFDSWSDSQLRSFLVDNGIVAPSGAREQLVLAAKKQYWAFNSASSSLSAAASTAVYGDKAYQATKTASVASRSATSVASSASAYVASVVADAQATATSAFDDSKDYIYSTWSDNELRTYLEEKGVIKTGAQATRDELLAKMRDAYASVADPVWKAWSDSALFEWLHSRGLVSTSYEKKRDKLVKEMEKYYYGAKDTAYSQWTESELKEWLVAHDVIKSDAQIKKEKLQKLVKDNYATASDTIYSGWKDSDLRDWLIANGYLRSDAQVKRDQLVSLMKEKYNDVSATTAAYLTWPDARLRSFLRAHGVSDTYLPATRPGLLQEARVRWVSTQNATVSTLQSIRLSVEKIIRDLEDGLSSLFALITGTTETAKLNAKLAGIHAEASAKSASAVAASKTASLKAEL